MSKYKISILLANGNFFFILSTKSSKSCPLPNGGGNGDDACDYCQGNANPRSSDNPQKAIISLQNDRETSYKVYISVQNELVAAYNELRNREYVR